jgi:hypothetical protein
VSPGSKTHGTSKPHRRKRATGSDADAEDMCRPFEKKTHGTLSVWLICQNKAELNCKTDWDLQGGRAKLFKTRAVVEHHHGHTSKEIRKGRQKKKEKNNVRTYFI